jgi:hypothetical protein
MKKFNESIQIEVSVDTIANMLLNSMKDDFKHRELVAESIVGRMLAEDKSALSKLYNSLNGYLDEINFSVGDVVVPSSLTAYGYWEPADENGVKTSSRKSVPSAVVKEINTYARSAIKLEYQIPKKDGTMDTETTNIHHTDCKKIVI